MAVSVTPLGANTVFGNFGGVSPWTAGSSVTLGTGDVVVFAFSDGNGGLGITGVTVGGVTAASLGTTPSSFSAAWRATGVNTATGNVSIATSSSLNYNLLGANWFLVTGEGTPSFTSNSFQAFNASSAPSLTATVAAGGAGLISLGCLVGTGALDRDPTNWTNCVSTNFAALESYSSQGNTFNVSGDYTTTTGSVSPAGSATGQSYAFSNVDIMMVTFPPAGAAPTIIDTGSLLSMMGVG